MESLRCFLIPRAPGGPTGAMLASLPLQMLFFFNGWYDVCFTLAMSALYAWKGSVLPYPDELRSMLGLEVAIVFLLAIVEYARIFLGSRGNKTEMVGPLVSFLVFSAPSLAIFLYYMLLQVYVTRLDLIISATAVGFVGAEMLLALLTIFTFANAPAGPS